MSRKCFSKSLNSAAVMRCGVRTGLWPFTSECGTFATLACLSESGPATMSVGRSTAVPWDRPGITVGQGRITPCTPLRYVPSPSELALTFPLSKMDYPSCMDHLIVLREKIGRLRGEIAQIQELNNEHQRQSGNSAEAQVAHVQRQERLLAIQQELVQLASLGPKVLSVEEMKERHRFRLHLVKQAS